MYLTFVFACLLLLLSLGSLETAAAARAADEALPSCPLCHVLLATDSQTTQEQMTRSHSVDVPFNSLTDPSLPPIPEFQSSNKEISQTSEATRSNMIYPESNLQPAAQRVRDVERMMEKLSSLSALLDRVVEKVKKYEELRRISNKQQVDEDNRTQNNFDYPISLTDDFLIATTDKPNRFVDNDQTPTHRRVLKSDHFNINQLSQLSSAKTVSQTSPQDAKMKYYESLKLAHNHNINDASDFLRIF